MERESFEDEETAEIMNELFINIKIDREERPDLDHIYMDAVQAIAGNGGWPLNVFLTPDRKPFYGGTYFPPVRAYNRASWKDVLIGVSGLFKEKREEVEVQAEELTKHIGQTNVIAQMIIDPAETKEIHVTRAQADTVFQLIMKQADTVWGGFGNAPKFPQTFLINYLLRYHHYTGNEQALMHATVSLDKMIAGGIYDQLGGGFARYSTDRQWLAPHFEKMLYDNALIICSLCDAYQLTRNEDYRLIVEQTIGFIEREMTDTSGGFYSALDADSEGVEGKFYVWSYEEVNHILGNDAAIYCSYYDISMQGNWEHTNILRRLKTLEELVTETGIQKDELMENLQKCSEKLFQERAKRIRPLLDDKVLLGWNALMIIALCKASSAFSEEKYKQMAIKNFNFLITAFRINADGFEFNHTWKNGVTKYPAFLDDYACLVQACISLQEITSDEKYFRMAGGIMDLIINNFGSENGYFFYTSAKQTDVIVRKTELYDGALPSGNSLMAANLSYLGIILGKENWVRLASDLLINLEELISKYPSSFGHWATLMIDITVGINEIAIAGKGFEKLRDQMLAEFIPNKVFQSGGSNMEEYPLMKGKSGLEKPLIFVCKNYTCKLPSNSKNEAVQQIVKKI